MLDGQVWVLALLYRWEAEALLVAGVVDAPQASWSSQLKEKGAEVYANPPLSPHSSSQCRPR